MTGLLQLATVLGQSELAALTRLRENVRLQEFGMWADVSSEQLEFSYHLPGEMIVHAARLLKVGDDLWDCFDLTADGFVIGTYHLEDAVRAVGDWFSVIEEIQPAQVAGAAA